MSFENHGGRGGDGGDGGDSRSSDSAARLLAPTDKEMQAAFKRTASLEAVTPILDCTIPPELYGTGNLIAQDIQSPLPATLVASPEQLGITKPVVDAVVEAGSNLSEKAWEKTCHPRRLNPDEGLDYKASIESYKASGLSKYGIDPAIIAGTIRNENFFRKPQDDTEESYVAKLGDTTPFNWSIGDAQMQRSMILHLITANDEQGKPLYPQLEQMRYDPVRSALDHHNAALLVGAFFEEKAGRLEAGLDPIPEYDKAHAEEIRYKLRELWATKDPEKRTDALIRTFNPGDGQAHVNHVQEQMKEVRKHLAS